MNGAIAQLRLEGALLLPRLIVLEHAAHLRRGKETPPELFVPDLLCEHSHGLHRPGERLPRLPVLPTLFVKLADPALDLPEFPRQSDLLG